MLGMQQSRIPRTYGTCKCTSTQLSSVRVGTPKRMRQANKTPSPGSSKGGHTVSDGE